MKAINAIICDDDPASLEQMNGYLRKLCRQYGAEVNSIFCTDGDMLLNRYQEKTDLLFLDVEMPLLDGIRAAEQIREKDEKVIIVFMSRFEKYAVKGYYAGAWRYLLKPVSWEDFSREMEKPVQKLLKEKDRILSVKNDRGMYAIPVDNIYYLEVNTKKNVDIHLEEEVIEAYKTLASIEIQLPEENFFRCHNSFLVNLDHIAKAENGFIYLRNGERAELSRRRRKEFLEKYMDYSMKWL